MPSTCPETRRDRSGNNQRLTARLEQGRCHDTRPSATARALNWALAHTLTLEGQPGRALEVLRRCEQTYAELTRDFPNAISYQLTSSPRGCS